MITSKNSAKAVIIRNGRILLLRKEYEDGSHVYTLPGGSQEPGETLQQAVSRETYEEVAARVQIEGLLAVYEHKRKSRKDPSRVSHKIEFAFICSVDINYRPKNGSSPDSHQAYVEWHRMEKLAELTLDPPLLADILTYTRLPDPPVYIEDAT